MLRIFGSMIACMLAAGPCAAAQPAAWQPEKPISVIVGTSPGGSADHTARLIQKQLQDMKVGASSSVVNKPGAGYALSFTFLNQFPGDAHYIAVSPINIVTNSITRTSPLNYTDVTPLAQLFSDYHVFSVNAESTVQTGRDLVERLRRDPGSLSIAVSPGFGTANHLAAGAVLKAAGVDTRKLRIVAFASGGESTTAVLGGHADVLVSATPAIMQLLESRKLRALATTGPQRTGGLFATTPTWKELQVDVVFSNWRGVIGPKGLTPAQIAYWDDVFARLVRTDEWKKDLAGNFQESTYMNSADSRKFLQAQSKEFAALLTELGLAK
jgi:putative tricarboxylic transport membrane protein